MAVRSTTVVSTKGQVILPKAIRTQNNWTPGTRLTVEQTPNGVLLRQEALFAPTTYEEVFGSLRYTGPPKTLEDMEAAIDAEIKDRRARGRY